MKSLKESINLMSSKQNLGHIQARLGELRDEVSKVIPYIADIATVTGNVTVATSIVSKVLDIFEELEVNVDIYRKEVDRIEGLFKQLIDIAPKHPFTKQPNDKSLIRIASTLNQNLESIIVDVDSGIWKLLEEHITRLWEMKDAELWIEPINILLNSLVGALEQEQDKKLLDSSPIQIKTVITEFNKIFVKITGAATRTEQTLNKEIYEDEPIEEEVIFEDYEESVDSVEAEYEDIDLADELEKVIEQEWLEAKIDDYDDLEYLKMDMDKPKVEEEPEEEKEVPVIFTADELLGD